MLAAEHEFSRVTVRFCGRKSFARDGSKCGTATAGFGGSAAGDDHGADGAGPRARLFSSREFRSAGSGQNDSGLVPDAVDHAFLRAGVYVFGRDRRLPGADAREKQTRVVMVFVFARIVARVPGGDVGAL